MDLESASRTSNDMTPDEQIEEFLSNQPVPKQADLRALHAMAISLMPEPRLWFSDGRNEEGKVVTNPSIGYGAYVIQYADGSSKEFFRVGISANASGISVYIMGLDDKAYLASTYGARLGKATVTGYCIKFKALKDIDLSVLSEAMAYRFSL